MGRSETPARALLTREAGSSPPPAPLSPLLETQAGSPAGPLRACPAPRPREVSSHRPGPSPTRPRPGPFVGPQTRPGGGGRASGAVGTPGGRARLGARRPRRGQVWAGAWTLSARGRLGSTQVLQVQEHPPQRGCVCPCTHVCPCVRVPLCARVCVCVHVSMCQVRTRVCRSGGALLCTHTHTRGAEVCPGPPLWGGRSRDGSTASAGGWGGDGHWGQ